MEPTTTRTKVVTTSQLRCFKQCRRRYWLEYVRGLKPIETPKCLEIGTLYHKALEMFFADRLYSPEVMGLEYCMEAACLATRAYAESTAEQRGCDYEPLNCEFALAMFEHFVKNSGWEDWDIQGVEREFEVSTGYAKRLAGKIDLVVRHEGKTYLLDHKTTSTWGTDGTKYLNSLLWNEQATNYMYAWSRMLEDGKITGQELSGMFFVVVEKCPLKQLKATPPENRKYRKDGTLYANQREEDETVDEYMARVRAWYDQESRVHTCYVDRTPAEIRERINDVNMTIRDMVACERNETYYRNPAACDIFECPYASKCLEDTEETDCLFRQKERQHEELEGNKETNNA